jgi:aspartate-semialdehyde dehydrogenase
LRNLVVSPIQPDLDCQLVFSALPSEVAGSAEEQFARAGFAVCSNASAHRMDPDVPLLIPEVNPDHIDLIPIQQRRRGWRGFIVASANCTATQLVLALKPLQDAFGLKKMSVVSMQAISGAGYPGVSAIDILGNIIPYIDGEEDKVESESLKLLGTLESDAVVKADFIASAQCNRVPVLDGHTECVSVEFESKPDVKEVIEALEMFAGTSHVANLPSSPERVIIVHKGVDGPQPARDRGLGNGMSVSVGRVRRCPVLDFKFVVLGHNTLRGAAGGSIHNAELLFEQNLIAP